MTKNVVALIHDHPDKAVIDSYIATFLPRIGDKISLRLTDGKKRIFVVTDVTHLVGYQGYSAANVYVVEKPANPT